MKIVGILKDAKTKKPVAGARVDLYVGSEEIAHVFSDENGVIEVERDEPLSNSVLTWKISASRYQWHEFSAPISETNLQKDIELIPVNIWWRKLALASGSALGIGIIIYAATRPHSPTILNFDADRYTISAGESVTLSWKTKDAGEVFLKVGEKPQEKVLPQGTRHDTPPSQNHRAQYTLVVRSKSGIEKSDSITVDVIKTHDVARQQGDQEKQKKQKKTSISSPQHEQKKSSTSSPQHEEEKNCTSFRPESVQYESYRSLGMKEWRIVETGSGGNRRLLEIGRIGDEGAEKVVKVIKKYGMNQICSMGPAASSFTYLLVSGRAPRSKTFDADEKCVPFHQVKVVEFDGQFKLVEGKNEFLAFPDNENAEQALNVIEKYEFNNSCTVIKSSPPFKYLVKLEKVS